MISVSVHLSVYWKLTIKVRIASLKNLCWSSFLPQVPKTMFKKQHWWRKLTAVLFWHDGIRMCPLRLCIKYLYRKAEFTHRSMVLVFIVVTVRSYHISAVLVYIKVLRMPASPKSTWNRLFYYMDRFKITSRFGLNWSVHPSVYWIPTCSTYLGAIFQLSS